MTARIRRWWAGIRPQTLAGRLAWGGVGWIAAWAVVLLVAFNVLLAGVLTTQTDDALRARAQAVAATIRYQDGALSLLDPDADDTALDAGTSIYLDRTLFEGAALPQELLADLLQRGEVSEDSERYGVVRYLGYPITDGTGTQVGTIVVTADMGVRNATVRTIAVASLVFVVLVLLFTFYALRGTIVRALAPVRAMGAQAAAWSDQDLDRRFDPEVGPLELRELSATLNGLLERIAAALRHERNFTAELSHELRTPLAHLHAEVDLLGAGQTLGAQEHENLRISIRRLEGLVETALAPARISQPAAPGLGLLGDALTGLRAPASSSAALVIDGDTSLTLAVDADIARRALSPLLENAFRYAVAEVRIEISGRDGYVLIEVVDDGGRLDQADVDRVFDAGYRADPGDGHPGAGLGLALTRRICRAAGGDVSAQVRAGHTVFTLRLPSLPEPR